MPYSNLATATNILWNLFEENNYDPEPLYRDAGIDPDSLKKPGMRVQYTSVEKIWIKAVEIIDDPCFGLKAIKFWHPSYLHALGYARLASQSLREAFNRFVRYLSILSEASSIILKDDSKSLMLTVDTKSAGMRLPAQVDTLMAIIIHMCRINYGEGLKPLSVNFIHPEPPCAEKYFDLFKSPVHFSTSRDSIAFSLVDVDKHLIGANPHIARANDQVIINYLATIKKENIVHRVKAGIIGLLPSGEVTDAKVAKTIGMSVRSLQRKLSEDNTTFRTLRDQIRKELALNYLRDPSIEHAEIAFLLGYSEQSAFSRSFKRLTGLSPGEVRNK